MTDIQKEKRLKFCIEKKNWTKDDWKRILWSDESPFELFHTSNRQNDRIWARDKSKVPNVETVKFSPRGMVWGMMSFQALSELHIIPPKQTVTNYYYVENILEKTCSSALNRNPMKGDVLTKKMLPNMSNFIFQQDGAPAHTAKRCQEWCRANLKGFWQKGEWPANSPDQSPIENLWGMLQDQLDRKGPATGMDEFENNLKKAWLEINPDIFRNLVEGMPGRIEKCILLKGGYIGK